MMASPGSDRHTSKASSISSVSSPIPKSPAFVSVDYGGFQDPLHLAHHLSVQPCGSRLKNTVTRRKRIMTPTDKKDTAYWIRRRKNNEAAKQSRERRRLKGLILQSRLLAVSEENTQLRAQLFKLQYQSRMNDAVLAGVHRRNSASFLFPSAMTSLPAQAHRPALIHAGLWGNSSASVVGATQREATSTHIGGFHHTPFLSGPRTCRRSAEADMDAHTRHSVTAPPLLLSYPTMSTSEPLPHAASSRSHPDQGWRLPCQSQLAMCPPNNWLLQYRPSYLDPGFYSSMPLPIQDAESQTISIGVVTERAIIPTSGPNTV